MLSTAVLSLAGFLFWLVAARFYSEAVVGYSSAIISALQLIALLSPVGFTIALVRFLPRSEKPVELINTCLTMSGIISLVSGGIFLAGLDLWAPGLGIIRENIVFCLAFLVFTPLWTLSPLVDHVILAVRRTIFVLYKNVVFSAFKIAMPILLVLFFHNFGVVASWGIALAIALVVALFLFLPRVQDGYKPLPALNLSLLKGMWSYSSGNYLVLLLQAVPFYLLPLMVLNTLGAEQNAYFYVAWMMGNLLFFIPSATSLSLFAEGVRFEDRLKENVKKSLRSTFLLLAPVAILLLAAGKWLLLAFGQSYSLNALNLLWVLCLSALPLGVNHIYTGFLRVTGRIKELALIWGFISLSVLVTSYLLIPVTGIIGVGYAWLGTHIVAFIYITLRYLFNRH
jgi:O-antigen/teichoic acid export membrane protein